MDYAQKLALIATNLIKSENVNSFDIVGEREADTLSHALLDMEESFKAIQNLIPQFYSDKLSGKDIDSILLEIGEELRHILYHLKDSRFYDYLNVAEE